MKIIEKLQALNVDEQKQYLLEILGEESANKLFEEIANKVKVSDINIGDTIKYANIKWTILDKNDVGVIVVANEVIFESDFSNSDNNWANSSLRKSLNKFDKNGFATMEGLQGIKKSDLMVLERDLITLDGMTDYGTCTDYISIYTVDEYRKYRKYIPNYNQYHWTITADSLVYSNLVRVVNNDGTLNYNFYINYDVGVRPFLILKSCTEVERI